MRIRQHFRYREHATRFERLKDLPESGPLIDDFSKNGDEKCPVERSLRHLSLAGPRENRLHVSDSEFGNAATKHIEHARLQVQRDNASVLTDAPGRRNRDPARTASDIENSHSLRNMSAVEEKLASCDRVHIGIFKQRDQPGRACSRVAARDEPNDNGTHCTAGDHHKYNGECTHRSERKQSFNSVYYMDGHSHPKTPAVRRPYISPSNMDLNVELHARLNQIESCNNARE